MSLEKKLPFWIKNNYNVLFKGKHGVGKSAMIIDAFNQAGIKWLYFSASTMDPFVDFVGIPKEVKDPITGNSYIDLIRPKCFQDDEVEAIFLDEFNRSAKKVRNAVMELIQFKSINGKKFSNLKIIWAAINPDDDDQKYDVEELDPAQQDRFHIMVDVPYAPHTGYFKSKYGEDMAEVSINWWKEMPADIKKDISPRRLDYALDVYKAGGDIRDVLPPKSNINKLMTELTNGSTTKKLKKLFDDKNELEAKTFLAVENNYSACIDTILTKKEYMKFFLKLMPEEKISVLISKDRKIEDFILSDLNSFDSVLKDIAKANINSKISKRILEAFRRVNLQNIYTAGNFSDVKRHHSKKLDRDYALTVLPRLIANPYSTQQRNHNYEVLDKNLPSDMSKDNAESALGYLADILIHSQKTTVLNKFKNLVPMINHVFCVLSNLKVIPKVDKRFAQNLKEYPESIYNFTTTPRGPVGASVANSSVSSSVFGPRDW